MIIVQNYGLPCSNRSLWLMEFQNQFFVTYLTDNALLVRLTVADLCAQTGSLIRRRTRNPTQLSGMQDTGKQPWMIVALSHVKNIAFLVLMQNVPGFIAETTQPADSKALPLSQRVILQPGVLGDDLFIDCSNLAGAGWDVLAQKLPEIAFSDKTDAGAVFLVVNG